jgi:hypothetical protein
MNLNNSKNYIKYIKKKVSNHFENERRK